MNTELKHHGIPGMRWGRRKGRSTSSSGSTKKSRNREELSELEQYKRSQKKKAIVKGSIAAVSVGALAVTFGPTLMVGKGIVDSILRH